MGRLRHRRRAGPCAPLYWGCLQQRREDSLVRRISI